VLTRDWADLDCYAVLGVGSDATFEEIGDAFRTLAKRLHPDVAGAGDDRADERFKIVSAAYEVLCDPIRRAGYDAARASAPTRAGGQPATAMPTPPERASDRWSPRRARIAVSAGTLAFIAGVAFSAFIVALTDREHAELTSRVEVVGTVVAGAPRVRVAFMAGSDPRPIVVAAPESLAGAGTQVEVAFDPANPSSVTAVDDASPNQTGRAIATIVHTETGTQVVYASGSSAPRVAADPSSRRSGSLDDGQAIAVFYDPDNPGDIRIDENTLARDITFWFVAVKLIVAGPILMGFARYRVRPRGSVSASMR